MVPPGTGGSNSFVQQRQEQRSGMRLAPSHPLHPEDLSSGPTTGHPRAACEGRLLGLPCPDPEAAGSSCAIYQAQTSHQRVAVGLSPLRAGLASVQSREQQLLMCDRACSPILEIKGATYGGLPGQQFPPAMAMTSRGLTAPSPSTAAGLENLLIPGQKIP